MNREEMLSKAQELIDNKSFDEASKLIDEIKKLDEDIKAKDTKAKDTKAKDEDINEEDSKEKKSKDEESKDEEPKDEDLKDEDSKEEELLTEELDKLKKEKRSFEPGKGVKKEMEKVVLNGEQLAKTETRSFLDYVRSHNPKLDLRALPEGVKSTDVGAIIPQDIVTKTRVLPETVVDLRQLVQTVKVNTPTGKYPILKSTEAVMSTVEELEANPDLDKPQFENVLYDVDTYRGQIPVSRESLDDSDEDLGSLIAGHVQRIALNTANAKIVANLKTAAAKSVKNLDDLKALINTEFDPAYNLQFIVSQSFYNAVDLMKDNEGRYLLQPSITAQSGKSLLGLNVTVISDKLLGQAGDKVAFLGDPAGFTAFFDRNEMAVRWQEHQNYGEILAAAMRFDVKTIDAAAGRFVTLATTP